MLEVDSKAVQSIIQVWIIYKDIHIKNDNNKTILFKIKQWLMMTALPWYAGTDGCRQLAVLSTIATPSPSFPSRGDFKNQVLPAEKYVQNKTNFKLFIMVALSIQKD